MVGGISRLDGYCVRNKIERRVSSLLGFEDGVRVGSIIVLIDCPLVGRWLSVSKELLEGRIEKTFIGLLDGDQVGFSVNL